MSSSPYVRAQTGRGSHVFTGTNPNQEGGFLPGTFTGKDYGALGLLAGPLLKQIGLGQRGGTLFSGSNPNQEGGSIAYGLGLPNPLTPLHLLKRGQFGMGRGGNQKGGFLPLLGLAGGLAGPLLKQIGLGRGQRGGVRTRHSARRAAINRRGTAQKTVEAPAARRGNWAFLKRAPRRTRDRTQPTDMDHFLELTGMKRRGNKRTRWHNAISTFQLHGAYAGRMKNTNRARMMAYALWSAYEKIRKGARDPEYRRILEGRPDLEEMGDIVRLNARRGGRNRRLIVRIPQAV